MTTHLLTTPLYDHLGTNVFNLIPFAGSPIYPGLTDDRRKIATSKRSLHRGCCSVFWQRHRHSEGVCFSTNGGAHRSQPESSLQTHDLRRPQVRQIPRQTIPSNHVWLRLWCSFGFVCQSWAAPGGSISMVNTHK